MAYVDATKLLDLQVSDATNDKRFEPHGLIDAAVDNKSHLDYIPPSVLEEMSKMSAARGQRIPFLKDKEVVVTTTPGFTQIPANLGETDYIGWTAVDVFSGFRFYPASFENNQVDANWYLMQTMENVLEGMASQAEKEILTVAELRKSQVLDFTTQVSQGDGTFTFDAGTDTLQVSKAAQKETMFYNLEQLMDANKLQGNYRLVNSKAGLAVQISEAAKYGANNEKNLQSLGFLPMDRLYQTAEISPDSDVFNGFLIRDGGLSVVENYPYDFRNGTNFAGKQWSISPTPLPRLNMRANIYVNTEASDGRSLVQPGDDTNLTMTHFEEMAIWARFYIVYRYNTDLATRANDIVKIKGLTT